VIRIHETRVRKKMLGRKKGEEKWEGPFEMPGTCRE
jgi:hypothetical protein